MVTFRNQKIYVGLDVHKKSWSVSIASKNKLIRTFTHPPNANKLAKHLKQNYPEAEFEIAYEAGFSGFSAAKSFIELGFSCIVINAADVPTTHKEKVNKTDPIDSKKIVLSLRAGLLRGIYIPSEEILLNRSLIRQRNNLVKDQTRCKNRIKHFLHFQGIEIPDDLKETKWTKAFLAWLESIAEKYCSLTILLQQLSHHKMMIRNTLKLIRTKLIAVHNKPIELLMSIPGIGIISAANIYVELADVNRFKSFDRLCSYVGLIPSTSSSGERDRVGYITPRGNAHIKNYLIEASWIAVSKDPELLACFEKLCLRMKKSKAIIRIAKKVLSRIKAVLTKEQPYKINYNLKS